MHSCGRFGKTSACRADLERELRQLLAEAARRDMAEFRARAAAIRAHDEGTAQTDSALLLREDRDR